MNSSGELVSEVIRVLERAAPTRWGYWRRLAGTRRSESIPQSCQGRPIVSSTVSRRFDATEHA
jgi:hypothetical protein